MGVAKDWGASTMSRAIELSEKLSFKIFINDERQRCPNIVCKRVPRRGTSNRKGTIPELYGGWRVRLICPSRTDKAEKIDERRDAVECTGLETSLDERRDWNLVTRVAGIRFSRKEEQS